MLLATALALLITGCAQQTFTVQNKPAAVAPKGNHHPSFLRFWNWAEENCRCSQNLWLKMLLKQKQQTFVNGLLGFITLRHLYSAGSACVLLTIIAWVAHRYGQLYLHCSLIYFWVPSSCFCIVISLSLRWNNPVQRCLPVGGLHYPRRRRWWLHALTDRLLWCAADDDQRQHHHAEHHFSFSIS